ncbi:Nif3-like dinuclear metal center hexameric protein [Holzapfeliella sp. He02]|uniref:GTP cyclohydrolase 1 type 2 homolog n=1 Tax=Holzapfeliella saturejae TaxID=3082953 RepID=A0ABU8SGH4_9LACO
MVKAQQIIERIEQFAPQDLALDKDPVGLQIGNPNQNITKIMTTLDVRPEVVEEAIQNNVDMIFSHHPLMFRPAKNLDLSNPQNAMYAQIIKHDIVVYSAHTNIDMAPEGMNDWLSECLNLSDVQPFAFELTRGNTPMGIGRKGKLSQSQTLTELSRELKHVFNLQGLRLVASNPEQKVQTVGIIGGDGGKFFLDAVKNEIDVLITGDVYYHTGHDMLSYNLPVIDPGHHIEAIFKGKMAEKLTTWSQENDWHISVTQSQISTDPYQFI